METSDEQKKLLCYNRGCGKEYNPDSNTEESCQHHPGMPFFHDAYKGWSCCNKKCTDFTEFLNIKGCTTSFHSNIKPPEPEKTAKNEKLVPEVEKPREIKPIQPSKLQRPSFDAPLTIMKAVIAPGLLQGGIENNETPLPDAVVTNQSQSVPLGTTCKNSGCNVSFESGDLPECVFHPGYPVFHEGLKFWSCCQKRTTDFNVFLAQKGCETGTHMWFKEKSNGSSIKCRWDWHQTGTHVIVSVYAKNYCPESSYVKLNPIRMQIKLVFPKESNSEFNFETELRGIIDVSASQVHMLNTKVEIKLRKAEIGSWSKLEIPHSKPEEVTPSKTEEEVEEITPQIESVDLSDLQVL